MGRIKTWLILRRRELKLSVRISHEIEGFLRDCGTALKQRKPPPSREAIDAVLDTYAAEMAALRAAEMICIQETGAAARVFAVGFALEQMRANLKDLADRVAERARS